MGLSKCKSSNYLFHAVKMRTETFVRVHSSGFVSRVFKGNWPFKARGRAARARCFVQEFPCQKHKRTSCGSKRERRRRRDAPLRAELNRG